MTNAPTNVYTANTANKAAKVRVFVGPADGSASSFTESFNLRPLDVFRIAGSRPDFATFELLTAAAMQSRYKPVSPNPRTCGVYLRRPTRHSASSTCW